MAERNRNLRDEPGRDHGEDAGAEAVTDGTIRLLPELTPGDERTCIRCLGPVDRETYFSTDFVCWPCDADWTKFPWRTTHSHGYAP